MSENLPVSFRLNLFVKSKKSFQTSGKRTHLLWWKEIFRQRLHRRRPSGKSYGPKTIDGEDEMDIGDYMQFFRKIFQDDQLAKLLFDRLMKRNEVTGDKKKTKELIKRVIIFKVKISWNLLKWEIRSLYKLYVKYMYSRMRTLHAYMIRKLHLYIYCLWYLLY